MQFSDFLAVHAARVAELAEPSLRLVRDRPAAADGAQVSRQLVNATLVAITAEDLRPLASMYDLERPMGVSARLAGALADLQAVTHAAFLGLDAAAVPPADRLAVTTSAVDEMHGVARGLALAVADMLERSLRSASTDASARGTSLSVTMHELRRPLTILSSYGQLLNTGMLGALPESALVAVEGITASTEMMVRMVNSLAEVSRIEDPDDRMAEEVVSAHEIVAAAVEPVAMEARLRGTTISSEVDPGLQVRGDKRRLTLALTNLVGNAVKHGPANSSVEVSAHRDGGGLRFLVRDHGGGFPPEDAAHLFDKYFRSVAERKRKVPGSGLGLYIVRTVAERHGGSVAARCVPGNGAEFEMIIPVHEGDT